MNKLEDLPDVLTADMVATFLSLCKRRVYDLMDLKEEVGGIPCLKIGRSKRILKTDLIEWMKKAKEER